MKTDIDNVNQYNRDLKRHTIKSKFNLNIDIRAFTMIGALVLIWAIFEITTKGTYLSPRNLSLLVRQMTITSILTTGVVLLIIGGHIDLSLGSIVGLTGGIAGILQVNMGWNPALAIVVALVVGILIGFWHGYWVAMQNVPAFIVTLGGLMIFRGVLLGINHGRTVSPFSDNYRFLGQGYLEQRIGLAIALLVSIVLVVIQARERSLKIKYGFQVDRKLIFWTKMLAWCVLVIGSTLFLNEYEGIPIPVIIMIVLIVILTFVATKTRFGRYVYALGGNLEASKLSGINVKKITLALFVISGLFAAIGGVILTARLNAAPPSAGTGAELDAIAAAVIGGTSLMGGIGSVPGAILGALFMASLDNGMGLMNVDVFYQQIIKGLILTLAVWFDVKTKK